MEHECIQAENIGTLKKAAENLESAIGRLDKRINGTFEAIGKHIAESPVYRSKIDVLETIIMGMKEEKNNTTKQSQWRVGLIVGIFCTAINVAARIIFH